MFIEIPIQIRVIFNRVPVPLDFPAYIHAHSYSSKSDN